MCSVLCCSLRKRKLQSAQTLCLPSRGGVGVAKAASTHWEEMPHYTLHTLHGHVCSAAYTRARTWARCCCLWINSHSLRDCAYPQEWEGVMERKRWRWERGSRNSILSRHATLLSIWLISFEPPRSQCCCCCNLFSCRHLQPVWQAQTYSATYMLFIYVLYV